MPSRRSAVMSDPLLLVAHVAAGGVLDDAVPLVAERLGRRLLVTGALGEPGGVVGPPRALLRGRRLRPLVGLGGVVVRDPVAGLRVARRVDQRGDVPVG